jgi:eukaryotic-like serine/threonine-protein kinase
MMLSKEYKILDQISGKRRFGTIYKGEHLASGEKVLIKVVRKDDKNNRAAERLLWEAQFTFETEGLPKVFLLNEDDDTIVLVSKWLEGVSLDQFWRTIKKKQRIPVLVEIVKALSDKLDVLHRSGIFHLDLKPGNLLVFRDEKGAIQISIIDFGLAKSEQMEDNRKLLFPLGYAAPEIILNQIDLADLRSDYFSLGILIWTLFSEKIPLSHPNPSIFTNLQLTHPLPAHSSINKKLQRILSKLAFKTAFNVPPNHLPLEQMRKELIKGMEGRYQNLGELLLDLEQLASEKASFYQRISFLTPKLKPKVKG